MEPPPKPTLIDKIYRTVAYAKIGSKDGNCEFDLMFDTNGFPHAVIRNFGIGGMQLYGLDPNLLRPSPVPEYVYVYLGVVPMENLELQ
jgi:hypothetical protein